MTSNVQSAGANAATGSETPAAKTNGASQVTKNMFLQLLVAQIKNQDPLNPADSVQYLTQLAQFEQLEQSMNTGEDIKAIRDAIAPEEGGDATTQA